MSDQLVIHKARQCIITVNLGIDVSGDTITSQVRAGNNSDSPLIAQFDVAFVTDGTDGELTLTLEDSITEAIEADNGYMDIKRVTGGEAVPVFERPLEVVFRGSVTE